ncbi:MAG: hypothetical protein NTV34_12135 [Proteobacteria bacterium]|nr:hypothetical protein [Pseudomonadota bacterium]
MLKRLLINQKWVPVPIPIKNLADAFSWLETSMIPDGQSLTSAILDGRPVIDVWGDLNATSRIPLGPDSRLDVRIESPMDLALQGIETAHTLCGAILRNVKYLAVHLWQCAPACLQPELQQMSEDVEIIIDLIDHAKDLGGETFADFGPMIDLQAHLKKIMLSLSAAFCRSDWRGCAQVLLRDTGASTGLESTLKMLQEEFETAHLRVLTSRASASIGQG